VGTGRAPCHRAHCLHWPPNATDVLKALLYLDLEHDSTADNARPRHLGIAFLRDYPCGGDCVLYAALGKTEFFKVDESSGC
jgi:hypothetical protein